MVYVNSAVLGNAWGAQGKLCLIGSKLLAGCIGTNCPPPPGSSNAPLPGLLLAGDTPCTNCPGIVVGNSGLGELSIYTNGQMETPNLTVGMEASGQGSLTVLSGVVLISNLFSVGQNSGSSGSVWLAQGAIELPVGTTVLGNAGFGKLVISSNTPPSGGAPFAGPANGTNVPVLATFATYQFIVGALAGASGCSTVGPGGMVYVNSAVLGNAWGAQGKLLINGGKFFGGCIGTNCAPSQGSSNAPLAKALLAGGSPCSNCAAITVGGAGLGELTILAGQVQAPNLTVGADSSGQGTVNVEGGQCTVSNIFIVGNADQATGTVWITGGKLQVANTGSSGLVHIAKLGFGQLVLSNGTVLADNLTAGATGGSPGPQFATGFADAAGGTGLVQIVGGDLIVTNAAGTATLKIQNGTLLLQGGNLIVDVLDLTAPGANFVQTGGTLYYQTLTLDPAQDQDGDGLPNGWEQTYGFDPLSTNGVNGAAADPDGDAMNNLKEYWSGTVPTNSASVLRVVNTQREGTDVRVTWTTMGGHSYVLQTNAPPANGSFTNNFADYSTVIAVPGTGASTTNCLHTGGATNQPALYYRIRLAP